VPSLYVATNGLSVWSSADLGETIGRMPSGTGLYSGSQVWSLATHPTQPGVLLCGTDSGVYQLSADGRNWEHLGDPIEQGLVTALAFDPQQPGTILAGTQPAALHRSEDGGRTWARIDTAIKPYVTSGFYAGDSAAANSEQKTIDVKHWTRVTDIVFHPDDPQIVLAGVEIDGAWRSVDGGRNWARVAEGLVTEDIHGFAVVKNGTGKVRLFATTCDGIHMSMDAGATWTLGPIDSPWQYTRTLRQRADGSGVVFVTNGNGPPGTSGRLFRSRDLGSTWENITMPVQLESSMYFMATNPADPSLIFAATNLGQIFRSRDGGETWSVLGRRLPEVRAMAWLPS
jgi:photosystem II stability/assembly factor-like uncharacterized protein